MLGFLIFYCLFSGVVTYFMLDEDSYSLSLKIRLIGFSIAFGWIALPIKLGIILRAFT